MMRTRWDRLSRRAFLKQTTAACALTSASTLAHIPWTSGTHKTVTKHNQWRQAVAAYLANDPAHTDLKRRLARSIPIDKRFKQFVRWGRWKCIFTANGNVLLFDIHETFGISEHNNVAEKYPQVTEKIRQYVEGNRIDDRHVTMVQAASDGGT